MVHLNPPNDIFYSKLDKRQWMSIAFLQTILNTKKSATQMFAHPEPATGFIQTNFY